MRRLRLAGLGFLRWEHKHFICTLLFWGVSLPALRSQVTPATLSGIGYDSPSAKVSPHVPESYRSIPSDRAMPIEILSTDSLETNRRLSELEVQYHKRIVGRYTVYICRVKEAQLQVLAQQPEVTAIESWRQARTELKQEGLDLSLNGITLLHHLEPALEGTGEVISIKEEAFDTADIDFRGRVVITPQSPPARDLHATNMASITAGGGNSFPEAKGVAWNARITSSDYSVLLPDPESYFTTNTIGVQNHSYGTGIENYYGIETLLYDASVEALPGVLHVFSSGNSGNQAPASGLYVGLTGWANLSGQFKQSKNTMSVGAVDSLDRVVTLSSRGPAYDGRIKPDIVAFGKGGTSESAAIVSGLSAILRQAYLEEKLEPDPPAALIRSILINTAKDIGAPGPDYSSGYGSVRAVEALRTIEDFQFRIDSVQETEINSFFITVPANTAKLKVTMAWTDPPAEINATKALVHDLDLQVVRDNDQHLFFPWVLRHDPHPDSLSLQATRGRDTLNNAEQVVIDYPVMGDYRIDIQGSKVSTSSQSYAVSWSLEAEGTFSWQYPTASDPLTPASSVRLRWQSNRADTGRVEYKAVTDTDWMIIHPDVWSGNESFIWVTPVQSGRYLLRWVSPDTSIVSDTVVITPVMEPKVGFVCPDSMLFYWTAVEGVDYYDVYALNDAFLVPVIRTTDTFYIERSLHPERRHYAVAPVIDSQRGLRSYGFDYEKQAVGCYINTFFLQEVRNQQAYLKLSLGSLYNVSSIEIKRREGQQFILEQVIDPAGGLIFEIVSEPLRQGRNDFMAEVVFSDGRRIASEVVAVYYTDESEVLVFPNPAVGQDAVQVLAGRQEAYSLDLYDMIGRKVYSIKEASNPHTIAVGTLSSGVYLVVVRYESGGVEEGKLFVRG